MQFMWVYVWANGHRRTRSLVKRSCWYQNGALLVGDQGPMVELFFFKGNISRSIGRGRRQIYDVRCTFPYVSFTGPLQTPSWWPLTSLKGIMMSGVSVSCSGYFLFYLDSIPGQRGRLKGWGHISLIYTTYFVLLLMMTHRQCFHVWIDRL